MKDYKVFTNFDDSINLFTDWQEGISYIRNKARELNRSKNDFTLEKFNNDEY